MSVQTQPPIVDMDETYISVFHCPAEKEEVRVRALPSAGLRGVALRPICSGQESVSSGWGGGLRRDICTAPVLFANNTDFVSLALLWATVSLIYSYRNMTIKMLLKPRTQMYLCILEGFFQTTSQISNKLLLILFFGIILFMSPAFCKRTQILSF